MIEFGDCRVTMKRWAKEGVKVQTCITSPPYYGLRSYMPNAVRIRSDIDLEKQKEIVDELISLGVFPIDHTLD